MINSFFDRIFIINLRESTDRWTRMVAQLEAAGITNYERFDATDRTQAAASGWPIPQGHANRHGITEHVKLGQLGCKISHYRAIELAKARGYARVLILEDDLTIPPEKVATFEQGLCDLEKHAPDWDLLWVYGCYYHKHHQVAGTVCRIRHAMTTAAYAITARNYDKALDIIKRDGYDDPVDDAYASYMQPHVNTYMFDPPPFFPAPELPSIIVQGTQM